MEFFSYPSFCGSQLWDSFEGLWTFFKSAGGQLFLLGAAFVLKLLWRLLRSPMPEAREFAAAVLILLVFVMWLAIADFQAISKVHSVSACFVSRGRLSAF